MLSFVVIAKGVRPAFKALAASMLFCLLAADTFAAGKREMYRYVNENGVKVINDNIPPEYAQKGYEVVNTHGDVIRVIEPSLTSVGMEERHRIAAEREAEKKWDRELLKRYSTVGDVESAKSRRLAEIDTSLAILKGNIVSLDSQIAREQSKAADRERSGSDIPEAIITNIKNFKIERAATERMIENRQFDYQEVANRFDRDIDRFKTIQQRLEEKR